MRLVEVYTSWPEYPCYSKKNLEPKHWNGMYKFKSSIRTMTF
jgi:hypothetical protein